MAETKVKKKSGLYVIAAAIAVLVIGYFILTKVNADASNWAGAVAPILIIGGYIMVAVGILVGWDE
jgi:undecaprenyl pyrophosphate phosphatase UppP